MKSFLLLSLLPLLVNGQKTFRDFRFDLDPNMPAEEPQILAQTDEHKTQKPGAAVPKPTKKHPVVPPRPVTQAPALAPLPLAAPAPAPVVPQAFVPPSPAFLGPHQLPPHPGFQLPQMPQQQGIGFGSQLATVQQTGQQHQNGFLPQHPFQLQQGPQQNMFQPQQPFQLPGQQQQQQFVPQQQQNGQQNFQQNGQQNGQQSFQQNGQQNGQQNFQQNGQQGGGFPQQGQQQFQQQQQNQFVPQQQQFFNQQQPNGFQQQVFPQNQQPPRPVFVLSTATSSPIPANKRPLEYLPRLVDLPRPQFNAAPAPLAQPEDHHMSPPQIAAAPVQRATQEQLPIPQPEDMIKEETNDEAEVPTIVTPAPPVSTDLWFKDSFDTRECAKRVDTIGERFRGKFPSSIASKSKDAKLAQLVQARLLECEKKSAAGHWDKVQMLLGKTALSKSEEEECRSGLIQERISCFNLLSFACQFTDNAFVFRMVPARIVIQEARQAENGAEKCRAVVRHVKQRLEG